MDGQSRRQRVATGVAEQYVVAAAAVDQRGVIDKLHAEFNALLAAVALASR